MDLQLGSTTIKPYTYLKTIIMSNIEPINFPIYGEATVLNVTVFSFPTNALTTDTTWTLNTAEGLQCAIGNYMMTEEQFAAWGQDNSVVDGYVAEAIGVVIVPPIV
jgi:hypothetical protein